MDGEVRIKSFYLTFSSDINFFLWAIITYDINIKSSPWFADAQLYRNIITLQKKEKVNTIEPLESFVLISKSCLLLRKSYKILQGAKTSFLSSFFIF